MRYYLIAGERSGDLHGSNLIKELRKRDPESVLRGFGGDYMQDAGMELTVHYRSMAFMGVLAVIANLRTISKRLRFCQEDVLRFQPDVLILIDYAGFNMRMARFAKKNGIKVFYYISPKVWAWNTQRAWKLKASVDRMFCILPFETEFFKGFGWEVDYVGNPVLDAVKSFRANDQFLPGLNLAPGTNIVALLPGSRKIELERMMPVLVAIVKQNPSLQFVVAAVETLPPYLYDPLRSFGNVRFVFDQTYDLLTVARAAIVTSGTATLETGLFRVPQAVIYKAAAIEYFIGIRFVKVKFISLVNLIANREVIREYLQHDMTVENVQGELEKLVTEGAYRSKVLQGYEEVYQILDTGSASVNAATKMIGYLKSSS